MLGFQMLSTEHLRLLVFMESKNRVVHVDNEDADSHFARFIGQ